MRRAWLIPMLLGAAGTALAADISVQGDWAPQPSAQDLVDSAGNPPVSQVESAAAVTTLTISNAENSRWQVWVARDNDSTWPDHLDVEVRYSGSDGSLGGTSYMTLGPSLQPFIEGAGNRGDIEIQVRIVGLALAHRRGTHALDIVYKVVVLPS